MALGFGANARMIAAFESNYGTVPTSGYHALAFSRHALSARQNLLDSDLLGGGRDPDPAVLGAITVDGEIAVPCDARQIGFWLKAMLGNPTTVTGTTIASVNVATGGTGFTSAPTVTFTGGGGTGAAATAVVSGSGALVGINVTNAGTGYTSAPTVGFTGGGGTGATATAILGRTHTFVSGTAAIPSMSIQAINPDIPLRRTHFGTRIDRLSLPFARDGLTTATLSLAPQGESTDNADRQTANLVAYAPRRFSSFQGSIRRDGALLGRVVSADFAYSNGLDRVETIRADGLIDEAAVSRTSIRGTLTTRVADSSLFDLAAASTSFEMEIGYVLNNEFSLLFTSHETILSRPALSIEGPQGIQAAFEYQGAKDPVLARMMTVVLKNDVASYP
jgi:hypothetical protein